MIENWEDVKTVYEIALPALLIWSTIVFFFIGPLFLYNRNRALAENFLKDVGESE